MIRFSSEKSYPTPMALGFGFGGTAAELVELALRPEVFLIFFFFFSAAGSLATRFFPLLVGADSPAPARVSDTE